ncbi:hypothetical protein SAMN05421788_1111 [Filimonas lacunae]|uniref:Uncharacterized protein n=1 Tax=Filimonas lacunae TaxID=477680 RepID=A0A1N7RAL3_9BACT|nr:hypothetical protein SAMN05421788_1111 [Filimonas lacunae]
MVMSLATVGIIPTTMVMSLATVGIIPTTMVMSLATVGIIPTTVAMSLATVGIIPTTVAMSLATVGIIPTVIIAYFLKAKYTAPSIKRKLITYFQWKGSRKYSTANIQKITREIISCTIFS